MMEVLQSQDACGSATADIVAGDLVCVREGVWRVMEVRTFARCLDMPTRVLKLVGADAVNRWQPCTLLEPFDRPRRVEAAGAPRVVSRARWMRTFAALVAAAPLSGSGCPATIADAQVTLMPHQIDPVLAILRGRASRLLLADAVGLGKTIQAALLVRELRARGCADRVLVLVPSGLREQWHQELSHRTGLRAVIIDAAALAARTRDLPPDVNPWSLPGIHIVSLDFIKQPSVLHGAATITWDILIADEAHNLNEGTDRLAAADLLARHSRHVVLLTATPHHGSDDAFATLCRVGHIGDINRIGDIGRMSDIGRIGDIRNIGNIDTAADPIAIFRRTRQTIGLERRRKVHVLRVTPTKQERRLHALLARYAGRVERECASIDRAGGSRESAGVMARSVISTTDADVGRTASSDASSEAHIDPSSSSQPHGASLAMAILLKRASSSAWSLERSLRRRLALLDDRALSAGDAQLHTQPALPFGTRGRDKHDCDGDSDGNGDNEDSDNDVADVEPSHLLGAPGLRSARIERAWLTLLIEASRNASRTESKPRALARLLRRCREPALIYTEYRDTLTHLARTLGGTCTGTLKGAPDGAPNGTSPLAILHGGLSANDRRAALSRFASGDARILLTTDAAGEGLNLHHRCRLVINIELPWNPNRLEQRIGRIDRLGQTRTVHAIHLVAADTIEEPMLARLTSRIAQIAATLGDAPAVLGTPTVSHLPAALHELAILHAPAVLHAPAGPHAPAALHVTVAQESTARESGSLDADPIADTCVIAGGTLADACIAPHGASELVRPARHTTAEASDVAITGVRDVCCRSVSQEAVDAALELHHLRAMRARAWRVGRRRASGAPSSRGDPLIALDRRAPLIAVIRGRRCGPRGCGAPSAPPRVSRSARGRCESHSPGPAEPFLSAATDCPLSSVRKSCACDSAEHRSSGVDALCGPGLLCIWRTRMPRGDGESHARAGPPLHVLTAIHVACDVPRFNTRKAIASFAASTLERCRERTTPLLNREVAAARERLRAADRERIERVARRDEAIAGEIAATLRARAGGGGMFQPLLFEDIAIEKTAMTGTIDDAHRRTRRLASLGANADSEVAFNAAAVADVTDLADAMERVESTLVMALVLR